MGQVGELVCRRLLDVAAERMRDEPVILLEGPRAVGKSTLLRQLAGRLGGTVVDLDDLPTRALAREDPTLAIDVPGPVLLDEYQHAPELLSAIKARLNRVGSLGGQFVLAGSSRHDSLPLAAEALTGRLHRLTVLPLAQAELTGAPGLLARLFAHGPDVVRPELSTTSRDDYAARIIAGGFPDALARSTTARGRWLDDYIAATLAKDVAQLKRIRQAAALPRVLAVLAGQTAQILNMRQAGETLRLDAGLTAGYTKLLEAVFLIRLLPAWGKTLTSRSAANPKCHVVDSGVAARLLRLSAAKLVERDATSLTEFGHLAESFVVGQMLTEASWLDGVAAAGHWRTYDGDEVDLVLERDDGLIVAIEVKAGNRAGQTAFRSLAKLRDKTGPAFRVGVAFHMGQRGHHYDDRLIALPIDSLWR
ncbi:MAG: ATP-binding protein [Propionibacteriaceae bacterium]|jgi:predicted AAA+ superfamily ATPase|nr:ATP-binding protein [Propionibacteriaceae bacterium]